MGEVKAIFFDLGDTLISSRIFESEGELRAIRKVLKLYGLDGPPSKYLPLAKEADAFANGLMEGGRLPGETLQEFGVRVIKAKYAKLIELMGGEPSPEGVEQVFRAHLEGIATARSLFPEVEEVLSALKGRYRLGLLSNNIVEYVKGPLEHLGLRRFFHVVVISGEENVRKPEPEIFLRALRRIEASPREAMMVGDSLVEDIQGWG